MRRWIWLSITVLALTGLKLMAQAQVFDPARAWQRRTASAVAQYHGVLAAGERRAKLDWEAAAEDRRVVLIHASHERALTLWLAAEAFRNSDRGTAALREYTQATSQANLQFTAAASQAFSAWTQATGQAGQAYQKDNGDALRAVQSDLSAASSAFAQAMPGFDKEPEASVWEDWQLPAPLDPAADAANPAQKAFLDAGEKARAGYRATLAGATMAWTQSTRQTTEQHRNKQIADELAITQLRKANRVWMTTMQDALADLRSAFRSAVRKLELEIVPG